jgi:hypothetical protein
MKKETGFVHLKGLVILNTPRSFNMKLNRGAKDMLWMFATLMPTLLAAMLIHPAVIIGTIIGVVATLLRGNWND